MADLLSLATTHCQSRGLKENDRILYCGDHFDDEGEFQMEQGLGPALDRSPPPNTCFWAGENVGIPDNEGTIKVKVHIIMLYLVYFNICCVVCTHITVVETPH